MRPSSERSSQNGVAFEEEVDSYVPYAGPSRTISTERWRKLRSTLCNCGALSIAELQRAARVTAVSAVTPYKGGVHDVMVKATRAALEDG